MKFEKLDRYMNEADEDFTIEKDKISSTLSRLPTLHSKWLRYYYQEQLLLLKREDELKKLYRKKFKYYMTDYSLQMKESKVIYFIESDEEYSKLALKVNALIKVVKYLEETIKRCNNINFIYKNIIEWEKFKMGVN